MAENTHIEWAHHTFNGWIGCTKVGPGCDHCYAEALATTRLGVPWGPGQPRRRTAESTWHQPRRWNNRAAKLGLRYRVFCSSLADVFDNEIDASWRTDLAQLIRETPHLDWLLLTKRIGNVPDMLLAMFDADLPTNFRVGATIVNQPEWDRDSHKVAQVSVIVGKQRVFLSMEPLLGPVNFEGLGRYRLKSIVGQVIVGGESGPHARPMHPYWARTIRDQCATAGVPFLFKQWGEWVPGGHPAALAIAPLTMAGAAKAMTEGGQFPDGQSCWNVGKKAAGRLLDGVQHDGYPA